MVVNGRKMDRIRGVTIENEQEIISMYKSGMTRSKIAKTLNRGHATITKVLNLNDIDIRDEGVISERDVNLIISEYNKGSSVRCLAKKHKRAVATISNLLRSNGVRMRDRCNQIRIYECDDDFFETINTEKKAYWLGFIYADGNLQKLKHQSGKLRIQLARRDEEILHKFKRDIKATNPIYQTVEDGHEKCGFNISSEKLYRDLMKQGVNHNKTFNCKFPTKEQVPECLKRHFIRGFMDGDGWVGYDNGQYSIGFCGTLEMLKPIVNFFNHVIKIQKTGSIYSINWKGNVSSKNKLDTLYEGSTVYLERKYKKYKMIQPRQVQNKKYRETEGI